MMALAILRVVQEFWRSRPPPHTLLFAAAAWIVLITASASGRLNQSSANVSCREYAWFHDFLATKSPTDTLAVSSSSLGPILQNYPAISFGRANDNKWQLKACLNDGYFYHNIFVLQRFKIDEQTGKLVESGANMLGDGFVLQTLAEFHFRPNIISRISRMVGVKGDPPPPPEYTAEKPPYKGDDAVVLHLMRELP
jgi:hypothetical protein